MDEQRIAKKMFELKVDAVRPKGRPRMKYRDTISADVRRRGEDLSRYNRRRKKYLDRV
jgi:hypothetical protein